MKKSIKDLLQQGVKELSDSSDTPRLDCEVLLSYLLKKNRLYLLAHDDEEVSPSIALGFLNSICKRKMHYPVAYLTGSKEFYGLEIIVEEGVLVPRPETEILVEEAFSAIRKNGYKRVLEIGVGSGCIVTALGVLLQKEGIQCEITGVDISEKALEISRRNIERYNLENVIQLKKSDIFSNVEGKYHCIISNPPYLKACELKEKSISREPVEALVAEEDGEKIIRDILKRGKEFLTDNGFIGLEIGAGQSECVFQFAKEEGYRNLRVVSDLASHPRIITGYK